MPGLPCMPGTLHVSCFLRLNNPKQTSMNVYLQSRKSKKIHQNSINNVLRSTVSSSKTPSNKPLPQKNSISIGLELPTCCSQPKKRKPRRARRFSFF